MNKVLDLQSLQSGSGARPEWSAISIVGCISSISTSLCLVPVFD
ncbi:hypothetical protein [Pseudonocardia sp. TRM90224]|nr:hypothetical protein [Pseudonocardia sp. TRM90224]